MISRLIQIARGCVALNFVSGDLSLEGIWEDLSVFFGDLIGRVHEFLQVSQVFSCLYAFVRSCAVSNDLHGLQDSTQDCESYSQRSLISWLLEDVECGTPEAREAFVHCCLQRRRPEATETANAIEEVRGHLVYVCHHLRLCRLLEASTTDHK